MSAPTVDQIIQEILGGTVASPAGGRKHKHRKSHRKHRSHRKSHRRSHRARGGETTTIANQLIGGTTWKEHLQNTYEDLKAGNKGVHGGQLLSEAMKLASATYIPKGGRR